MACACAQRRRALVVSGRGPLLTVEKSLVHRLLIPVIHLARAPPLSRSARVGQRAQEERLQEVAWAGYQHVGREADCAAWQRRRAAGCHRLLPGCRRSPRPSKLQACTAATEEPGRGSSTGRFPEPSGVPSPAGRCWARGAPAFSHRACAWHAPGFLSPCRRCGNALRQIVVLRSRPSRPIVMGCTRVLAGTTAPATRVQADRSGGRAGHRRPGLAGASIHDQFPTIQKVPAVVREVTIRDTPKHKLPADCTQN